MLAQLETPGSWLAGRRLVAMDRTYLDVADTPANDDYFGRPGVSKGERSAFPMARVAAVIECGTHAVIDAEVGAYTTSEPALVEPLLDRLVPGMLALADRGLVSLALALALWRRAVATGADMLWRVKNSSGKAITAHPIEDLPDGSWLARIDPPKNRSRDDPAAQPLTVWVIDYTLHDGRRENTGENDEVTYRLFTSILDQASAVDLAVAYAQRWEIESVFDEHKTHQRGPTRVLRSKSPPLARQEIWGHVR